MDNSLPDDDFILLSLINTKLRDGESAEDFCAEYGASFDDVCRRLEKLNYYYNQEENAFKRL